MLVIPGEVNSRNGTKIEGVSSGKTPHAPPTPRRPRNSSMKDGPTRGSLLEYAMEDVEADMKNLNNDDSSSQSSGSGILPSRKMPFHAHGSLRRSDMGGPLPARRLSRGSFAKGKGVPFRGNLKDVMEVKESGLTDADADLGGESWSSETASRQGRMRSVLSATSNDKSIGLHHSDKTSSSASQRGGMYNESINIMDFGVDPNQGPFTESLLSHGVFSTKGSATADANMSYLVDSQGFLGWDSDSSTNSDESQMGDDSSQCLGAENIEDEADEKEPPKTEKDGDNIVSFEKSWRIEDYEDSADMIDHSQSTRHTGSGNILGNQIKQFSDKVTEGISGRRNAQCASDGGTTEIKTNYIKRILLRGASGSESDAADGALKSLFGRGSSNVSSTPDPGSLSDANRANNNAAGGTLKSLFGGRRDISNVSSAPDPDDDYYSRAIRVDREDGIDIGELRRELCMASAETARGNNANKNIFQRIAALSSELDN